MIEVLRIGRDELLMVVIIYENFLEVDSRESSKRFRGRIGKSKRLEWWK